MNSLRSVSKKALIPLIPGLILLLGFLILFALSLDHRLRRDSYLEARTTEAEQSLLAFIGAFRPFAETIAEKDLFSASIRSRIEAAWDAGPGPYREGVAREIAREIGPLYAIVDAKGFRQIQYHLPDASLLLDLSSRPVRPAGARGGEGEGGPFTVQLVNASLEPVEGFETDRALSGYHFAYPLLCPSGRPVGSVRLTLCPGKIIPLLEELTRGTFFFLESKEELEAKGLTALRQDHLSFPGLGDFLVERSVLSHHRAAEGPDAKTVQELCRALGPQDRQRLASGASFSTALTRDGKPFRATFLPLRSLRRELVGYLAGFAVDGTIQSQGERYRSLMVATGLIFALLALLTWLSLRNHLAVENLATWDALTGALFREPFLREAEREFARSLRHGQSLAWIMFDVDHFKEVNDSLGHAAGDRLLRALGRAVSQGIRTSDLLARWGGDEFLVLAPETSERQAFRLAERIMDLAASLDVPGAPLKLSVGIHVQEPKESIDESLRKVDEALYRAKNLGRNRIARWNP